MESETAYLQTEPDYYDSDDNVWRCAPGELKIKIKTWGPTGTTGWKLHSKYATLLELAAAWERVKAGDEPLRFPVHTTDGSRDGWTQAVTVELAPPVDRPPIFIDKEDNIWRCIPEELTIEKRTFLASGLTEWELHTRYATAQELTDAWEQLSLRGVEPARSATEWPLPQENTLPAVLVDHTPEALTNQWRRANAGLLEIVRFGAMLVEIDTFLKRQKGSKSRYDPSGTGTSLQTWMEANCPDINYKTAMGYKVVAEQMRDKYKVPAKLPLTLALPQSDGTINVYIPDTIKIEKSKVEKYQREFYGMCEGKSMYQLTLDLGIRDPKSRGGDRKSGKDTPKLTKEQQFELQVKASGEYWNTTLNDMCFQINKTKSHKMLNEAELTQAVTRLRVISDALKDALKKDGE